MSKAPSGCGELVTIAKCSGLILQTSSQEHASATQCVTAELAYPQIYQKLWNCSQYSQQLAPLKALVYKSSLWKTQSGRKQHLYTISHMPFLYNTTYKCIPDTHLTTHKNSSIVYKEMNPHSAGICNLNSSILILYHRHQSLANWILKFGHQPLISCFIAQERVAFVLGFLVVIYLADSIPVIQTHLMLQIFPFERGPKDMKGILSVMCPSPQCPLEDIHRKSRTSAITVSHGSK